MRHRILPQRQRGRCLAGNPGRHRGANAGSASAYGADPLTESLTGRFEDFFEHPVACFLVGTGTAANALSLAALCPPWGAVLCHAEAHITIDECGAPELFTGGAKLVPLAGATAS